MTGSGRHYTQANWMEIATTLSSWYSQAILGGGEPTAEQQEALNLLADATIAPEERLYDSPRCPSCSYQAPKMGLPFFSPEVYVGTGLLDPDVIRLYPSADRVKRETALEKELTRFPQVDDPLDFLEDDD